MTLANGSPINDFDRNLLGQIQTLLQVNNDFIVTMHKAFIDSSTNINRRIDGLQDQVIELKRVVLQTSQQGISEEATKWRSFTESMIDKITNQHNKENVLLAGLLKLSISGNPKRTEEVIGTDKETEKPKLSPETSKRAETVVSNVLNNKAEPTIQTEKLKLSFDTSKHGTAKDFKSSFQVSSKIGSADNEEGGGDNPEKFVPSTNSCQPVIALPNLAEGKSTKGNEMKDMRAFPQPTQQPVVFSFLGNDNTNSSKSLFGGGTKSFATVAEQKEKLSFLAGSSASSFGTAKDFKIFQSSFQVPSKNDSTDNVEGEDDPEKFVPSDSCEPVIPLPNLVEVKTGEEEEQTTFMARCKLFRYDPATKENKERGVGEMKVLFNPQTKRYRCVMRRDQIHKICANFPIHKELKITQRPNVPTVYNWHCTDYSDEASGLEVTLHAKFKDKEIAKEFAGKINEAVEYLKK